MDRASFMRGLIRELVAARGDCSVGSLMNCHARGLHSIVLRDRPMVRLFVAAADHELSRMGAAGGHNVPTAIAFHSHHCDLRLETVSGVFYNWTFATEPRGFLRTEFDRFTWDSAIKGGAGRFSRSADRAVVGFVGAEAVPAGRAVTMGAPEIHTVEVEAGKRAAWLVTEGREDPHYDPTSYSPLDLTTFDPSGLYRPMTRDEADALLSAALAS